MRRLVPFLLIFVAALAYYGSYWHFWFNPHDECGTACLVAQRLLQGERPWVDVEPGYNLGWFYPIVGLFHFTGVNYLAVRAWFFALSTITALLGCGIVTRVSGSRCLGLIVGLLLVVFPGSQFKSYIPLLGVAIVPLNEPVVVAAVVDRFRMVAVPAPVLVLLTTSGPVAAPKLDAPTAVSVPAFTVVPPE